MERRLIGTDSPYEKLVGYSRAVVVGDRIFVAGTAPTMDDGGDPPPDVYGQTMRCFERIEQALREAGSSMADVVRSRVYLVDAGDFEGMARAHGETFAEIRPANTTVVAGGLLDPRWLVEIEVEAVRR